MRKALLLSIALLLGGCAWTNQMVGRLAGKKTTAQVFTQAVVTGQPVAVYGESIQLDGDGVYRRVIDEKMVSAVFTAIAEDGQDFRVECPVSLVSYCMGLGVGERVKVNGTVERGAVLLAEYIKRK